MEQENKQENRFEETMIEGRNAVLEAFRSGKTEDKMGELSCDTKN